MIIVRVYIVGYSHTGISLQLGLCNSDVPSGVVVPGEVGILLIYAPNCFFKRPSKG